MKAAASISLLVGLLLAMFNMYVAWQHNPQCEFHCDGTINWLNWFGVGASWLIVSSLVIFSLTMAGRAIWLKVFKLRSDT